MPHPFLAPLPLHRPKKALGASPPPSGEVAAADATGTGDTLIGDAPPRPQVVRPLASPAAIDSDDELMMEVMQEDDAEAAAHLQHWNMWFAVLLQLRHQQMENVVPRRGGSVRGNVPNKDQSRNAGACCCTLTILQTMQYTPKEFRRCFRMKKDLFMKIVQGVREYDDYFKYKKDCTGNWGFISVQKCTTALRCIAYGSPPDTSVDYL
jgi:hypothetical protein